RWPSPRDLYGHRPWRTDPLRPRHPRRRHTNRWQPGRQRHRYTGSTGSLGQPRPSFRIRSRPPIPRHVLALLLVLALGALFASGSRGVLDILQSVPILGFFSVTVAWFLAFAPGKVLGTEFVANLSSFVMAPAPSQSCPKMCSRLSAYLVQRDARHYVHQRELARRPPKDRQLRDHGVHCISG